MRVSTSGKKQPRVIITVTDLPSRQFRVDLENMDGVPPIIFDRIDVHVQKALYVFVQKKIREAQLKDTASVKKELKEQAGDGRVVSQPSAL